MTHAPLLVVPHDQDDVARVDLLGQLSILREELLELCRGRRSELAALTLLVPAPTERLRPALHAMLRLAGFPALELHLVTGPSLLIVAAEFERITPAGPDGGSR